MEVQRFKAPNPTRESIQTTDLSTEWFQITPDKKTGSHGQSKAPRANTRSLETTSRTHPRPSKLLDQLNLGNLRTSLIECYFKIGKIDDADSLFREWLSAEPDWGFGWIGWSDLYWLWNLGIEKDFNKS